MSSMCLNQKPSEKFFSLPNELFALGLSAGAISVYSYLLYIENRKTFKCWPSSSRTAYPACPCRHEPALIASLLLIPTNPLRWALPEDAGARIRSAVNADAIVFRTPRRSPTKRVRRGKKEPRSEPDLSLHGGRGCGARDDARPCRPVCAS